MSWKCHNPKGGGGFEKILISAKYSSVWSFLTFSSAPRGPGQNLNCFLDWLCADLNFDRWNYIY